MGDAGVLQLLIRTAVSLAIVLAIVGVAYLVAKWRARGGSPVRPAASRGGRRRSAPAGVEVVGRVGLNRGTAAVAIRFGDRVVLVSSSEQAGTTALCEMPADEWDELQTVREPITPAVAPNSDRTAAPRPNFIEALRQATARHA